MKLKIRAEGGFGVIGAAVVVLPGDTFNLILHEVVVHSWEITKRQTISRYALVTLGDNVSYFIGGESLVDDLLAAGAEWDLVEDTERVKDLIGRQAIVTFGEKHV